MPTLSIIGPGAIGGTLAIWLSQTPGNHVSLCARTPFQTLSLKTSDRLFTLSPPVFTSPDDAKPVDWIILATKTYQVPSAAPWIQRLSASHTRLAVAQNGVEHLANLQPYFDPSRIVPIIIDCPVERSAPGKLIQHGPVTMTIPNTDDSKDFAALFTDPSITLNLTDDWLSAAWQKLCLNCSGAVCALVDEAANIAQDPRAASVMESLIRECIAVGRAEGAHIDDALAQQIIAGQSAAPDGSKNSLHADYAARRPMEWDARNGVIARLGQQHNIPTPCNQMAAQLLSLLESAYLA